MPVPLVDVAINENPPTQEQLNVQEGDELVEDDQEFVAQQEVDEMIDEPTNIASSIQQGANDNGTAVSQGETNETVTSFGSNEANEGTENASTVSPNVPDESIIATETHASSTQQEISGGIDMLIGDAQVNETVSTQESNQVIVPGFTEDDASVQDIKPIFENVEVDVADEAELKNLFNTTPNPLEDDNAQQQQQQKQDNAHTVRVDNEVEITYFSLAHFKPILSKDGYGIKINDLLSNNIPFKTNEGIFSVNIEICIFVITFQFYYIS